MLFRYAKRLRNGSGSLRAFAALSLSLALFFSLMVRSPMTLAGPLDEEDAAAQLQRFADQDRALLEKIAANPNPTLLEFGELVMRIHESSNPLLHVSNEEWVKPARQLFLKINREHPELLADLIRTRRLPVFIVGDLIKISVEGDPAILAKLFLFNLLKEPAIEDALARGDIRTKTKIAVALFELGIPSPQFEAVWIDALASESLPVDLEIIVMHNLGVSGTVDPRAVAALKKLVMPPMTVIGATVANLAIYRLTAVDTLGKIPTQASADALWEIAGLRTEPDGLSRPLPDEVTIVPHAKALHRQLVRNFHLQPAPVKDRICRRLF